jgi:phage terminase small subunit
MSPAVIWVKACELLKNGKVAVKIKELTARASAVMEKKFDITVEKIADELGKLAFFNPADLFNENGDLIPPCDLPKHVSAALHQIEMFEEYSGAGATKVLVGYTKKVKWHDKKAALEVLARWKGMLIERREVGKPGEFSDLSDAELDAEIKACRAIMDASDAAKATGKQPVTSK